MIVLFDPLELLIASIFLQSQGRRSYDDAYQLTLQGRVE